MLQCFFYLFPNEPHIKFVCFYWFNTYYGYIGEAEVNISHRFLSLRFLIYAWLEKLLLSHAIGSWMGSAIMDNINGDIRSIAEVVPSLSL